MILRQDSVSLIRSSKNLRDAKHPSSCEKLPKNQNLQSNLNPSAQPFSPYVINHIIRFIAKRDLISSRFSTFNDNPSHLYHGSYVHCQRSIILIFRQMVLARFHKVGTKLQYHQGKESSRPCH